MLKNITRRQMLKTMVTATAGAGVLRFVDLLSLPILQAAQHDRGSEPILRFGIVADSHSADADGGSRAYRESLNKMAKFVEDMNNLDDVEFLVELGDFIDGHSPTPPQCLAKIEAEFSRFKGARYHVLGNHCHDDFSKEAFLRHIENTGFESARPHYSFDRGGIHFVVLDPNYREDGEPYDSGNFSWTDANLPESQLEGLERDLNNSGLPTIVFIHQQLDGTGSHYVNNAAEAREILQKYGKTLAVFQGHQHSGAYSQIEGIHYYTLRAMVTRGQNSYGLVEIWPDSIAVKGYHQAVSREMESA